MVKVSRLYRSVPGFRRVKRAWRSRGFGIHSPFAFRFITCVLRQRGKYYAYGKLHELAGGKGSFRRTSLVFRLVCEFAPEAVAVTPDVPAVIMEAIRLADSRVRIVPYGLESSPPVTPAPTDSTPSEPSMFVCGKLNLETLTRSSSHEHALALIGHLFSKGGVVVVLDMDREGYLSLTRRMTCGMSFTNRRTAIFFSRPDLPRQDFEINF